MFTASIICLFLFSTLCIIVLLPDLVSRHGKKHLPQLVLCLTAPYPATNASLQQEREVWL